MPHPGSAQPTGYWWECDADPSHVSSYFAAVARVPLVKFFYDLADSGWKQELLRKACTACGSGEMRVTYDFPRSTDPVRPRLLHVVGLTENLPSYLPMLWEAQPRHEAEPWIDFKYVGRSDRGYQSYGLARPAVFARSEFLKLLQIYRTVVGHDLLA